MVEPIHMRFTVTPYGAVPAPPAPPRYIGRKTFRIEEASKVTGWPVEALVALHRATYPPGPDDDSEWIEPFADALYQRPVRDRLAFHTKTLGDVPPAVFLIALLNDWDSGDGEAKTFSLMRAMGVTELAGAGDWDEHCRAQAEGSDHA